jgi:hypothetical protein
VADFNWVNLRAKCSLAEVFEQLRLDVKADVEHRQGLRASEDADKYAHAFHVSGNRNMFAVVLRGHYTKGGSVTFSLEKDCIAVSGEKDDLLFRVNVTLNSEGRCIAKIAGEEVELWQVRQKALESLFFETDVPFNTPA